MSEIITEVIMKLGKWVNEEPSRSVKLEYRDGHWEAVFNASRMNPVKISSKRTDDIDDSLYAVLEVGLEEVTKKVE